MGIWVDSRGWFSESSLCKDRHFAEPYTPDDYKRLSELVKRKFKWEMFQGGDPNGPIMYAVQSLSDAPVKYHYPLRHHRHEDATMLTLGFLKQFLPDRQLIIRPHPKFWSQWTQRLETYKQNMRKGWTVDQTPNIYDTLKKCSAVVSVGSTVLTEALALGIPCAALGDGAYTGSESIMECSHAPDKLAKILSWVPERDKVLGYLCSIIRDHQIPFGCDSDFIIWLQ